MVQAQMEFHPAAPVPLGLRGRNDLSDAISNGEVRGHSRLYSRLVSLMKLILPLLALVVIALVVAWPHLDTTDIRFRIGFAAQQLNDAEGPNMINPRYVGTDKDNQPFSLTADLARNLSGEISG